jgi:hypothetical protein
MAMQKNTAARKDERISGGERNWRTVSPTRSGTVARWRYGGMRDHAVERWRWAVVVLVLNIMRLRVVLDSIGMGFD